MSDDFWCIFSMAFYSQAHLMHFLQWRNSFQSDSEEETEKKRWNELITNLCCFITQQEQHTPKDRPVHTENVQSSVNRDGERERQKIAAFSNDHTVFEWSVSQSADVQCTWRPHEYYNFSIHKFVSNNDSLNKNTANGMLPRETIYLYVDHCERAET